MMRLVMAHYQSVCVEGLAPLWCLQGASSICSKLMAGCHVVLPVCQRDEPVVVALRRLVGLAFVVLVMLLPAAFAGRLRGRNRLRLAGFIQRHLDLHGGVGVGVLVRRHHERGMVAGSERKSLCLRRVSCQHPLTKYWIAWTSWTPSQLFWSMVQRASYLRPVSIGPCTHMVSWLGRPGRL